MKRFNTSASAVKSGLRLLLLMICGLALGINVYLANASSLVGNQLPMPFGYGAAVVLSGSMEPELSKGDLIVVTESKNYGENDIVVYQDGNVLVVHRIISVDGDTLTTKGDANKSADAPITHSLVKGKVLFHIPFAGSVVEIVKTPLGTILIIVAAIALIEIPRRKEKKHDDEEREKILQEIERLKKEI